MNKFEIFGANILFWIIFTLVAINIGFIFEISITEWTLPATYFLYIVGYFFIFKERQKISYLSSLFVVLIPLIFLIFVWLFSYTLDSSYDGQSYHQSAVIALAHGWNPWLDQKLPIQPIEGDPFIIGYPKSLWIIQSSIYKIYPHYINGATMTNLLIASVAFILVFNTLLKLGLSKIWSLCLTIFIILQPTFIQEFFTFMADGFGYQVTIIAISSFILLQIEKNKKWPLAIFLSSLILLPALKYSNLAIFAILLVICTAYLLKIIRHHIYIWKVVALFLVAGLIILWVPYGKNFLEFGSPIYPSNLQWAQDDLVKQNIPHNLKNANKLELLSYGIFSKAQKSSGADSAENIAELKLPFTTTKEEIEITDNYQGRVGSEGVFFSGLFLMSMIIYVYLIFYKKTVQTNKIFNGISAILAITFIAAILNPIPNELHYVPIFSLVPIYVFLAFLLITKKTYLIKIIILIFSISIAANIFLKLGPTIIARNNEIKVAKNEMLQMKNSNKFHDIQAKSFYSTFVRLQEHGVKFKPKDKLTCPEPTPLALSNYTAFYCK